MSTSNLVAFAARVRGAGIVALFFLISACVTVGELQREAPIKTVNFKGSEKMVAQCIQQRLSAKVRIDGFNRYIVYDAVKNMSGKGLTHYSMTVSKTGPDEGTVEWRIIRSGDELDPSVEKMFWIPTKMCAEEAKPEMK